MKTKAISLTAVRQRLLEGILLRLARRSAVDDFVLRGGMLLRHWFWPHPRPVGDLDLVANFPFAVEEGARRFLPLLADETVADGVTFSIERTRIEGIWLETGSPGVRVFTSGVADGVEVEFNVDITFGLQLQPAPVFGALATACGQPARLWMCRPETIIGQKMQALWHLGMLGWRPKDLEDLRLLLTRVPLDEVAMRRAIAVSVAALGGTGNEARAVFGPSSWWGMKFSSARWLDFVESSPGRDVPRDLAEVVAEVAGRLAPLLEDLP